MKIAKIILTIFCANYQATFVSSEGLESEIFYPQWNQNANLRRDRLSKPPFLKIGDKCILADGTEGTCRSDYDKDKFFTYLHIKGNLPVICNHSSNFEEESFETIFCLPHNINVFDDTRRSSLKFCDKIWPDNYGINVQKCSAYIPVQQIGFPYMGALGWLYLNGSDYHWRCGAALISSYFAITAASCTFVQDTGIYKSLSPELIRFGVSDDNYKIKRIYVHPEYKKSERYHDIALIEIRKRPILVWRPKPDFYFIHPICVKQSFVFDRNATAIGWNFIPTYGPHIKYLSKESTKIVNNAECNVYYANGDKTLPKGIINGQICVENPSSNQNFQVHKVSMLMTKYDPEFFNFSSLIGIDSACCGCIENDLPCVYTRVSYYLDWIENIIWRYV